MNSRFVIIKLIRTLLTLLAVLTFVFIVLRMAGNPVEAMLPEDAEPDTIAYYSEIWGLDKPLYVQYGRYFINILNGDLGFSYRDNRPVQVVVFQRIPATLKLGFTSLFLSILVGIPLGIYAAMHRNTLADRLTMAFAVFGFAIPNFFFGILLILLFSLALRWLPSSGTGSAAHFIMPAATLGLSTAGTLARFTRSAMLEVMSKSYLKAAQAKGVPRLRRMFGHALPNAAIPIVTVIGFSLGGLIGGSVITETVFAWPGVGRLLVTSVGSRDLAVVQFLVIMIAFTMISANLTVDLAYGWLDPRIRVSSHATGA